jgi:hypothetical protein
MLINVVFFRDALHRVLAAQKTIGGAFPKEVRAKVSPRPVRPLDIWDLLLKDF